MSVAEFTFSRPPKARSAGAATAVRPRSSGPGALVFVTRVLMQEMVMSIPCTVILRWGATPVQLTALGTALWRWSLRTTKPGDVSRRLNSQVLADLIAGRFPEQSMAAYSAGDGGVCFRIQDEASHNWQATVDRLRREIPSTGIEDVLVGGMSWTSAQGAAFREEDRSGTFDDLGVSS